MTFKVDARNAGTGVNGTQELELFAQLRGLPRFKEWLDQEEAAAFAILRVNPNPQHLHQAQGVAQMVDRMKKMLVGAHIATR